MPTNDERREVAARLRDYVDLDFEDANPYWYVMKSAYGDVSIHGDNELFSRLADLIEPDPKRTCGLRSRLTGSYCYECSECGKGMKPEWAYCPSCGAKVV